MKIISIKLKNLASLEGEFTIDFEDKPLKSAGIFAISGATGSGKSTILDAMCLALYDKAPRFTATTENLHLTDVGDNQINQSDVRNILRRGTGDGFAEVTFESVTGHIYCSTWSVRRARNSVSGSLQAQTLQVVNLSTGEDLKGTKTELLNQLTRLTGLSYEQFTRTVLLAQNDFATFLKSRESAKAELLEKLTGTEIYTRISQEIYIRTRESKENLLRLKERMGLIQVLSEEEIKLLEKERNELAKLKKESSDKLNILNAQFQDIQTIKKLGDHIITKSREEVSVNEEITILNQQLKKQTDNLEVLIKEWEAIQPEIENARNIDIHIQTIDTAVTDSRSALTAAAKLADEARNNLVQKKEHFTSIISNELLKDKAEGYHPDLIVKADKVLKADQAFIHGIKSECTDLINKLNGFGIDQVAEKQKYLLKRQQSLLKLHSDRKEWETCKSEWDKINELLTGLQAEFASLTDKAVTLEKEYSLKKKELETIEKIYENARLTVSENTESLRNNLKEGEECPVCGSRTHPYCISGDIVDELFAGIEKQFTNVRKQYDELNTVYISCNSDLKHKKDQIESLKKQVDSLQVELEKRSIPSVLACDPALLDDELHNTRKDLENVVNTLNAYQVLYTNWKSKDETLKELSQKYDHKRQVYHDCNLLVEQINSGNERLLSLEVAERKESEKLKSLMAEKDLLIKQRSALLNGLSIEQYTESHKIKEKSLSDQQGKISLEIDALHKKVAGIQGEIKQMNSSLKELLAKKNPVTDPVKLAQMISDQKIVNDETDRKYSALDYKLSTHTENCRKIKSFEKEYSKLEDTANRWDKLNQLFGSADGKKFKIIAQTYTLELLLLHANKQLSYLTTRYSLQQIPGSLAIQVVDKDMCDEVRTIYSLSGGESFLVSLALALGLSSLSSRNLKVESLFIDEGFGSLDAESLSMAMNALEQLQMKGRKIGVISHVQEMTERIAVQIRVDKTVNGRGSIRILS